MLKFQTNLLNFVTEGVYWMAISIRKKSLIIYGKFKKGEVMTLTFQDSVRNVAEMDKIKGSLENNPRQDEVVQALDELLAGTNANSERLEDVLQTLDDMKKEEEMQEGALCLTGGMILGSVGLHVATGGKFDILKPTSRIAKFLETVTGKVLAGLTSVGGILLAMFGVKNIVNEVNNN